MKIIVFGANGMLGTYMVKYLTQVGHNVTSITRSELDIFDEFKKSTLNQACKTLIQGKDLVINCTGITNKRPLICTKEMYIVNGYFPHVLDNLCHNVTLVHPTTDCVFNGLKGSYSDQDSPDCIDDYGISKSIGEKLAYACVIRVSIIGEALNDKSSLIEWLKSVPKGTCINGYTNHYWNGITCLEYAKMIQEMCEHNSFWVGLKHIRSDSVTKHWLVSQIIDIFDLGITVTPYETPEKCDRTLVGTTRGLSLLGQLKELVSFSK